MPTPIQDELAQALAEHGLRLRGHWTASATDALPTLPDGSPPGVVWLVGVVGSDFWPHFKASPHYQDGQSDPLDRWSRTLGEAMAQRFGGVALYPFDGPPYWPFQRWADRAEPTQESRMLLRIHPQHGLWHAYRFALALPQQAAPSAGTADATSTHAALAALPEGLGDLCSHCSGQPCLQACPVDAYTGSHFVLQACAQHLHSGAGAQCMQSGCLARRACPVGAALRYTPEHAAFHMQAFAAHHTGNTG